MADDGANGSYLSSAWSFGASLVNSVSETINRYDRRSETTPHALKTNRQKCTPPVSQPSLPARHPRLLQFHGI